MARAKMLLAVTILGLGLLLILAFWSVFTANAFFGKDDFTTGRSAAKEVGKIITARHLEHSQLYDLGSGRGGFAAQLAQDLPDLRILGIDDSFFRIFFAKARSYYKKNLAFKQQDIFTTDVSNADIVYLYLPQEIMQQLQTKLQKELKPGSLVITNKVSFPTLRPTEKIQEFFIYQTM